MIVWVNPDRAEVPFLETRKATFSYSDKISHKIKIKLLLKWMFLESFRSFEPIHMNTSKWAITFQAAAIFLLLGLLDDRLCLRNHHPVSGLGCLRPRTVWDMRDHTSVLEWLTKTERAGLVQPGPAKGEQTWPPVERQWFTLMYSNGNCEVCIGPNNLKLLGNIHLIFNNILTMSE